MLKRIAAVLITFSAIQVQSSTHTVAMDGSAEFTSVQAAINAAKSGDIVEIVDSSTYKEQVTIDSTKNGLTLRSSNPTATKKPVIMWQDKVNVGPKNLTEAKIDSLITFDHNGAVRIMHAKGILIDGIIVDGGGAYAFGYSMVWPTPSGMPSPLFHGNAALTIHTSGDAVVRNCEFQNAYFGIYIKDRIDRGIFSNPEDTIVREISYYSGFDKAGNHLIEYNRIHNNSWGLFFESAWDLGSNIRYNLIYENHHSTTAFATQINALPDGNNQPGGAVLFKDLPLCPLAIYNNTFWHNFTNLCGHWQAGVQYLIFNNIFGKPNTYWKSDPNFQNPYQDLDAYFAYRMHNCLYSCLREKPNLISQNYRALVIDPVTADTLKVDTIITGVSFVRIANEMSLVETAGQDIIFTIHLSNGDTIVTKKAEWVIQPGALVTKPFSKDATIRWLETDSLFKSLERYTCKTVYCRSRMG